MTVEAAVKNPLAGIADTEYDMVRLDLSQIHHDTVDNIRDEKSYSLEDIEEIAAQILNAGGLLQPICVAKVKPSDETHGLEYILISGFRRVCGLLHLAQVEDAKWGTNVKCNVLKPRSHTASRIAQLMENTARKDLNPMETAIAINDILTSGEVEITQKDLAVILGMSEPAISQHKKLLRFPVEIRRLMTEEKEDSDGNKIKGDFKLQFSHARVILSTVPEDQWTVAAEMAAGMQFGEFEAKMKETYGKSPDGSKDEEGDGKSDKESQKQAKMLRSTELSGPYKRFLEEKAKKADAKEKKFTEQDLVKARLDTVNTVLKETETTLAKEIAPFLEKVKEEEEKEKANKKADNEKKKFVSAQVRKVRDILTAGVDPTDPDAKRPDLPQAVAQVSKAVSELKDEECTEEKLGFKLDKENFTKVLHDATVQWYKDKQERERKKAEEEAEKAKKEAEEKAKAAEGGESAEAPAKEASTPAEPVAAAVSSGNDDDDDI